MRKRIRILGMSEAWIVGVVSFFILGVWMKQPGVRIQAAEAKVPSIETFAQAVKAGPKISSIHIQGRIRTSPGDNFSCIDSKLEFVPIEVWKEFGEKSKWRVEKPGRVIVMDGETTIMLMKPNEGVKIPRPTEGAFDSNWLLSLANVRDLLVNEQQLALAKGWDIKLARKKVKNAEKMEVTVKTKSEVDEDDDSRNKWINTSDTRRVYRFDAKTKRLEDIQIYLQQKNKDVLIYEANNIVYDKPIDLAIFTLELPEDVSWYQEPQKLPDNEKYEKMTPKEAAEAFFEACSNEDWDEAQKFWSGSVSGRIKEYLGGLQIISIGEPFQSKGYTKSGWFVPYEIKLKNGAVKKLKLAVRNDNPGKRYIVDGGI